MEEKNVPIFKTWLNYGLITAVILIVFELVFYVLDLPRESYIKLISYLVFIGGIIWAAKSYRDIHADGLISYGKSFTIGFMTGLLASLIVAIYTFVFLKYFDVTIIPEALEQAELKMLENQNLTDDQIDQALAITKRFMTPAMMALVALLWNTLIVAIISLIASIFIKKEDTPF